MCNVHLFDWAVWLLILKQVLIRSAQFLVALQHVTIKSYALAISSSSWSKEPFILPESLNLSLPNYLPQYFLTTLISPSPQLVVAAEASLDCEAWLLVVAGVTGAAAPTTNMLVNLTHSAASIFSFFSLFSLSFSAPDSHQFFHTKLFLQGAKVG